jgi:hypothetical protein
MKMTDEQKAAYKLYRAECRVSNVEPVLADFLAGDINSGVRYHVRADYGIELPQPPAVAAMAATA